ncbi:uncharacterized protein TNCV_2286381 [Trichonephila clavipes]|nr:uncharacterized protein TNCV_2286381 [Trichonephila clavipes]
MTSALCQQVIRFTHGAANADAGGIQRLQHRWQCVVIVAGDYIESLQAQLQPCGVLSVGDTIYPLFTRPMSEESVRKQIVMASKRKHSTLTLKDKLEVLKRLDKGEGVTKLATEFNVGKATICDWRKNRKKLEQYCANSSGETLFFWRNIHRFSSLKL